MRFLSSPDFTDMSSGFSPAWPDPYRNLYHRSFSSSFSANGKRTLTDFLLNSQFNGGFVAPKVQRMHQQHLSPVSTLSPVDAAMPRQEVKDKDAMTVRLQELEKRLLEDDDDGDDADAVAMINSDSEWSETMQSLVGSSRGALTFSSSCPKQALLDAAAAISEAKIEMAEEILTRVSRRENTRVISYMIMALKSRMNSTQNPPPVAELCGKEHAEATQLLYELSPCFKLGFMAANAVILETTNAEPEGTNRFCVVDFDIGQGGQYMNLLHGLSSRPKASSFRLTTLAENEAEERRLNFIGDKLIQVADRVGVEFHFNVATCKLGDLSRESLGCEKDELLIVNFAFVLHRMPDESVTMENPRDELLRRVKALHPTLVTLVEKEINTNTAPFAVRVADTLLYYGALFESIETTVPAAGRRKVEEGLGRNIQNSVACEGRERVERCEVFGKWKARMGMAGFKLRSVSQRVADAMRGRLSSGNRANPGFTVAEDGGGGVCFGWKGRPLAITSAWEG